LLLQGRRLVRAAAGATLRGRMNKRANNLDHDGWTYRIRLSWIFLTYHD
jgi:hypothetical protein